MRTILKSMTQQKRGRLADSNAGLSPKDQALTFPAPLRSALKLLITSPHQTVSLGNTLLVTLVFNGH